MDEADGVAVPEVPDIGNVGLLPRCGDDPFVIVVLVVVARHLLLL